MPRSAAVADSPVCRDVNGPRSPRRARVASKDTGDESAVLIRADDGLLLAVTTNNNDDSSVDAILAAA